jgi:hypothetical protein
LLKALRLPGMDKKFSKNDKTSKCQSLKYSL